MGIVAIEIISSINDIMRKPIPIRLKITITGDNQVDVGELLGIIEPKDEDDNLRISGVYFDDLEPEIEVLCVNSEFVNNQWVLVGKIDLVPKKWTGPGIYHVYVKFTSVYGDVGYKHIEFIIPIEIISIRKATPNKVFLNVKDVIPGKEYRLKITGIKDKNGNPIGDKIIKFKVPQKDGWEYS